MIKPSYADILKKDKKLTSPMNKQSHSMNEKSMNEHNRCKKDNMQRLINFSNEIKKYTMEELWSISTKKIQDIILAHFESNALILENSDGVYNVYFPHKSDSDESDIIVDKDIYYLEDSSLMLKIKEIALEDEFYIPYYTLFSKWSGADFCEDNNQYLDMLNDSHFLKQLRNKLSKHNSSLKDLGVYINVYNYTSDYEKYSFGLKFTFYLLDNVDYSLVNNDEKIINYLLKIKDDEIKEQERLSALKELYKTLNEKMFQKVCESILSFLNKNNTSKNNFNLYEVCALLRILNAFSDYSTISYRVTKCYEFDCTSLYSFTDSQSIILNKLMGYNSDIFKFSIQGFDILVVFTKSSIDDTKIPDCIMQKCKNLLEINRVKARKALLSLIEKNKQEIINDCFDFIKHQKCEGGKETTIKLRLYNEEEYTHETIETPLLPDPYLITPDFELQVNNILGLIGFKIFKEKADATYWACGKPPYNKDRKIIINNNIVYVQLYMNIPDYLLEF